VKLATVFLAPLVALLIMLPSSVAAVALPIPQQAEEPDATPTEEVEQESPVRDLYATAGRLRGRVELGWSHDLDDEQVAATEGVFVVERSTNGSSWRPVKACYAPFDAETDSYSCTDTRLASGTTYSYRVCLAAKATTCSNAPATEPVSVKAP
jgi:hypothetical protein